MKEVENMDYKELAFLLLDHVVEGWGVSATVDLLRGLGYTDDEIRIDLDLEEEVEL
jgi:hypothetical protein